VKVAEKPLKIARVADETEAAAAKPARARKTAKPEATKTAPASRGAARKKKTATAKA
jgi:hypothetical protein